jgi:hypothetical protein
LCLDRGYDYPVVRELTAERKYTPHIRTRGEEIWSAPVSVDT